MNEHFRTYRRPYRRGDFRLVDTKRDGTYWQSREGLRVRIASGEGEPSSVEREMPAWNLALAALFGVTTGR